MDQRQRLQCRRLIAIGEHSLATTANRFEGERSPAVTVKRQCDLSIDLATALVGLRLRLPPSKCDLVSLDGFGYHS